MKKFLFLNQMAGPLFRELAEDLSKQLPGISELYTGHQDTLNKADITTSLKISKSPRYNRKSKFTRILSWVNYTFLAFFKIMFSSKNTVIFLVSNPPILGAFAFLICKIKNLPYVVLVYDMHPDTLISFGVLKSDSRIVNLWRMINRKVYENSAAVYTIGDVMGERLLTQFDVTKTQLGKVGIVPPWADTKLIKPISKNNNPLATELHQADCITVLYSGNMGISHDIDSMLHAAKLLKNHSQIKFLFIGGGEKWQLAYDYVQVEQLLNVQVLPFQAEERLPFTMALGDISLVALDKGAEGLMVPSKMYYYMAAGSAVIGICQGRNDLEQSLAEGDSGLTVLPGDFKKLAEIILLLADDSNELRRFKKNARRSSIEHFSREACMKKLMDSLKSINLIPPQE
jgi:glycosyltransferase involved in cell wall biosynthesis